MIAGAIGTTKRNVLARIKQTPELNALYPGATETDMPVAPSESATMLRTPAQLPVAVAAADLGQMVQATEKLLARGGLKKLGVPEATIAKLRDLRGLNIDFGAFLAVSLQDTHQLYYLRLMKLDAMLDEIDKRYLAINATEQGITIDQRMTWQRTYNEGVAMFAQGWRNMMAGTEAMVAMERGKEKNKKGTETAAADWEIQVPKSVSRAAPKG